MKKISIWMVAAAAVVMSSCGGSSTPKAALENELDTLCYAYGMAQSNGFKEYAYGERGLALDSTCEDELIKGILDGANVNGSEKQKAYFAGVAIGQQLSKQMVEGLRYEVFGPNADSTQVVNLNDFLAGFLASVKGEATAIPAEGVEQLIREKMSAAKAKAMESQYSEYKKQNEDYMKKVAKEDGVKPLKDGVYYKVLTEGKGVTPKATDRVKVNYEGKTIDGNIFDSTFKEGREAIELGCNQVIKGWTDALTNMPVGSKWLVYIPSEAGYGAQDQGPIKPFSTLIFTIELLDVVGSDADVNPVAKAAEMVQ